MGSLYIELKLSSNIAFSSMVKYFSSQPKPEKFPHILEGTINLDPVWI